MAPHWARDGGRGGNDGRVAWKPRKKVPLPRSNLGPKLANELAMQRNVSGQELAHPSVLTSSLVASALLRVWRELPELQKHAPLGAIVATNAPLPETSQGAEALREAAASELARCRRAFMEGARLPRALTPEGGLYPDLAVYTALLADATAGEDGILGAGNHSGTFKGARLVDDVCTAAEDGFADAGRWRPGPPPPPASALDASAMSPAYSRMFRSGAVAAAVLRALKLPPEDLCVPSLSNGVRVSTSAGTLRSGGGAGAAPAVDFGIRRCDDGDGARGGKHVTARPSPFVDPTAEWPAAEFVTRHVTATNTGLAPVLIVAVVCVPEMRDAFRVRCDHCELARHSGDREPPGSGAAPHSDSDAGDNGPVVLFPGASYEVSVDFRAAGRRDTPGHVAQWVLFATVECPVGWKTGDGFPARRARAVSPLDESDGDDADVDPRDVRIAGCRAVAVVLRGSRERRQEVANMMLNPETPKFVPKRLREAFDEAPRALVSPPACLLGFAREAGPGAELPRASSMANANANANANAHGFMGIHPSVAASVSVPAAYAGPDGALVPRSFFRVTQDGAREGPTAFEDASQWQFSSREVTRWARALAVEERRQALDIRRYDMHDAVFVFAGRTPRPQPGLHYDTYALDVPGLLEGYPPVAPLDVLKLRLTKVGGGRDETALGSRFFGSVASGEAPRRGERFDKSDFDFHVEDERLVVRRGGTRGKRPGGWLGSHGVVDTEHENKSTRDAMLDTGLPLDVGTEVCVTVFRVVPRKALVIAAFPPCVSRTLKGEPRIAIRAHVRFTHDVNAFKAQRLALLVAQANPATLAMLRPFSSSGRDEAGAPGPSAPEPGDANALEANLGRPSDTGVDPFPGLEGVGGDAGPFPFSRRVVSALRARLNDEQWRVVRDVCAGRAAVADRDGAPLGPPYCAFGPPGTGKTVTVAAAVVAVLATQADAHVLVCAPAPFAADVACARLAALTASLRSDAAAAGDGAPPPALEPVSTRDEEGGGETIETKTETVATVRTARTVRTAAVELERDGWSMVRVNDPRRDPATVKSDVSRFCAAPGSEGAAARRARVVVASCASAGVLADLLSATPVEFTHVFVDEAGQATVPETLVPVRMTSASRTRALVLAGDPKQLGPVVHSACARALRESLLASAVGAHERASFGLSSEDMPPPRTRRLVKLTRNYRSHRDIFGLSSRLFYDDALVAAAPPANVSLPESLVGARGGEERLERTTEESPNPETEARPGGRPARVLFVGVRGVQTMAGTGEAPSFFNAMEARTLVDLLAAWLAGDEREDDGTAPARYADASADGALRLRTCDVGVIAPYRAQVVHLRTLLRARGLGAVRVGTVDDYQGQEEKVMFISTVASRGPPANRKSGDALGAADSGDVSSDPRLGFLACPRRFNVAVTRAKALNVIVGHPVALERWTHWKALLRHCLARGAYVGEGALAADLGIRGRAFLPAAPSSRDEHVGLGIEASRGAGSRAADGLKDLSRRDDGERRDDEDEREALASAIERVAEASLLGGGDADAMFPDFEVGTSFGEHQSWRVAL